MVEVSWINGSVEDIKTPQVETLFTKFLINKWLKDELVEKSIGFPLRNLKDESENKIENFTEKDYATFVNICKKTYARLGNLSVNELAKQVPKSKDKKQQISLYTDRDYPTIKVKEADTPSAVAEFSGLQSAMHERPAKYPKGFHPQDKEKKDIPDPDKPKEFSQLKEQLINDEYVMTKQDFEDCYSAKAIQKTKRTGERAVSIKPIKKKGEVVGVYTELEIEIIVESSPSWTRSFYKNAGFKPGIREWKGRQPTIEASPTTTDEEKRFKGKRDIKIKDPKTGEESIEESPVDMSYFNAPKHLRDDKGEPTEEGHKFIRNLEIRHAMRAQQQNRTMHKQLNWDFGGAGKTFKDKVKRFEKTNQDLVGLGANQDGTKFVGGVQVLESFKRLLTTYLIKAGLLYDAIPKNSMLKSPKYVSDGIITIKWSNQSKKARAGTNFKFVIDIKPIIKSYADLLPYHRYTPKGTERSYPDSKSKDYGTEVREQSKLKVKGTDSAVPFTLPTDAKSEKLGIKRDLLIMPDDIVYDKKTKKAIGRWNYDTEELEPIEPSAYAPSSKGRELFIKSVAHRYDELDDLVSDLMEQVV